MAHTVVIATTVAISALLLITCITIILYRISRSRANLQKASAASSLNRPSCPCPCGLTGNSVCNGNCQRMRNARLSGQHEVEWSRGGESARTLSTLETSPPASELVDGVTRSAAQWHPDPMSYMENTARGYQPYPQAPPPSGMLWAGGARISTGTFPSRHLSTEFASAQAVTTPFGMREEPHIRYQGEHPGAESISDTSWSTKTPQASGRWVAETADAAGIVMQREMEELDAGVLPPGYEKMLGTLHRVLKKFSPGMEDEIALEEGDQVLLNFTFEDGWGQGTNLTSLHQGVFPLKCLSSNALLEKVLTEAYLTDLEKTSREIATSMHAPSSNDPSLHDLQFVPSYTSDSDTLDRIRAPPTTPAFPASPDTHYRKPVKHPSIYSNHTQEDSTFTSVTSSPVSPIPPVRSSSFDALVRPQIVLPRSMHTTISPTLPARLSLRRVQTSSSSSSSASSPRLNPIATPPTVEAIAAISEASLRKALERDPDTFDRDTVGLFRNLDEALVKRRVTLGKYFKERSRIVEVLAVRGKVVDLAF